MDLNVDNKILIDRYIQEHLDSKLDFGFPISLKGRKKVLPVYRLPTNMLFYNVRNGRFAAEYKDLVKREGGDLRPENKDDADKIKQLLLSLDEVETKRTLEDLSIRGQWNCGIITNDGYVIDGNRRMAIISKLHDMTGLEKWKYLDVARLEGSTSPDDLWMLEAGIQLGKEEIVRYGPINELLKIREGTEAGLTIKTIVNALYGSNEEDIRKKLDRLELMEQYLKFMGIPEQYSKVKNRAEHFIDLQNIIASCKNRAYEPDKIIRIKKVVFQLISEDIPHLELRKIQQMINRDLIEAISEIEEAASELKPIVPQDIKPETIIEQETTDIIDEFEENDEEISTTYAHLVNAKDMLDVSNNEGKEILLLNRAEKNLRPLVDYNGNELSTTEAAAMIKKIARHVEQITKKIGE